MADTTQSKDQGPRTERIELQQPAQLEAWARKLDASAEQIREAVAAVGDKASDVEEHLKGTRSTTNSDRVQQALQDTPADQAKSADALPPSPSAVP